MTDFLYHNKKLTHQISVAPGELREDNSVTSKEIELHFCEAIRLMKKQIYMI